MNIETIRNRYDPENDSSKVTWVDMQLAEEIERLNKVITDLTFVVAEQSSKINTINQNLMPTQRLVLKIIEHLGI